MIEVLMCGKREKMAPQSRERAEDEGEKRGRKDL